MPPTSQKLIRKGSFLHRLWLIARHTLPRISIVVFIGYSLPDTDLHSEWLFRQFRFVDAPHPEIVVVNPDMGDKSTKTCRRYSSIFRGCKITSFETLKDFAGEAWRVL